MRCSVTCLPSSACPRTIRLRAIRALVDDVLRDMSREFDGLYARVGRPSIPPERLLRAQLLQIFYSIRSERLLMEQLDYNLLFRWFVGMDMDEPIWAPTVFSKNRDRLLNQDIARSFFRRVVERAAGLDVGRALHGRRHADRSVGESEEFSAEGRRRRRRRPQLPRPGSGRTTRTRRRRTRTRGCIASRIRRRVAAGVSRPPVDRESPRADRRCHGDDRRRLCRTRGGDADGVRAVGTRARAPAHGRAPTRRTTRAISSDLMRELGTTPHVTQNLTRAGGSAIDGRTTRHAGYAMSQHARPRIEPAFGWLKTIAWMRKVKLRGLAEGRLALRLRERRVQSDPVAEAAAATGISERALWSTARTRLNRNPVEHYTFVQFLGTVDGVIWRFFSKLLTDPETVPFREPSGGSLNTSRPGRSNPAAGGYQ